MPVSVLGKNSGSEEHLADIEIPASGELANAERKQAFLVEHWTWVKVCSCLSLGLPMCSTFLLNGAGSMTHSARLPGGVYKPTYGCSQTDHGSFMTGSWFVSQP